MHALIVAASPLRPESALLCEQAKRADVVVAVDGGAGALVDAGITVDLFVGDGDSTEAAVLECLRADGTEILLQPVAKDDSDLGIALDAIVARGLDTVTIAGVFGGRLDHELAMLGAIATRPGLEVELIADDAAGWLIRSGGPHDTLRLTGSGATVSVFAIGGDAQVTLVGTTWPLVQRWVSPLSPLGLSNMIDDEVATVTAHAGTVLVLSPGVGGAASATRL